MRSTMLLAATVLLFAACSKDATGPHANSMVGDYTITQYYDSLNGGWSASQTGSLTLTDTSYAWVLTADIYFNIPVNDHGTYVTSGSNITEHSYANPDCVGTFTFKHHAVANGDTLTVNCVQNGDQLISRWVK